MIIWINGCFGVVKCFSNPRNMGRCCLDSTKVFRRYAKTMGDRIYRLFFKIL